MRYFMADPHFGHEGIVPMMARVDGNGKLFTCSEEHDHALISNINALVGRSDELVIAGDWSWRNPMKYRQRIVCRHIKFILGNHDKRAKMAKVFGHVYEQYTAKVRSRTGNDHIKAWFSHYPTAYWDGSHRGDCHLYGHTHSQREATLDALFPGRRAMDIGVDNIYRVWGHFAPIAETLIFDYMADRDGHDNIDLKVN